ASPNCLVITRTRIAFISTRNETGEDPGIRPNITGDFRVCRSSPFLLGAPARGQKRATSRQSQSQSQNQNPFPNANQNWRLKSMSNEAESVVSEFCKAWARLNL